MNPAHDLGGARGFGAINRTQTAVFAEAWEEKVFGMTLACGMLGRWNLDQSRFARERMAPAEYLAGTYYEHWLHGLELLLVERNLVSKDELRSGKSAGGHSVDAGADTPLAGAVAVAVTAQRVAEILRTGAPTLLPAEIAPRFAVGAAVKVREGMREAPAAHTRAPRYTRGHAGVIARHHGAHIFPDRHAADGGKHAAHLYSVRFAGRELWGESTTGATGGAVYVDLFEPYLAAADAGP